MKFMCHIFVPGAAFGEVHVSLFVAGAAFGEMWNDRTNFVALQPLWAARCLRRIRQPRLFVCIAVLHPTAQDLRCLAMHDFFSIGLLVSYRFMFF